MGIKAPIRDQGILKLPLGMVFLYIIFRVFWLFIEGIILEYVMNDMKYTSGLRKMNELIFLVETSIIIFLLTYIFAKRSKKLEEEIISSQLELTAANKELQLVYDILISDQNASRILCDEFECRQELKKESEEKYQFELETSKEAIKEIEVRLKYLEYHDPLTGLKNRSALGEKLRNLLKKDRQFALLLIDIDNFKYINDSMGHTIGDILLKKVSERLVNNHGNTASMYRVGGDEFLILMEHFSKKEDIERLAVNVIKAFKAHLEVETYKLYITVSIGISCYPKHGTDVDSLYKNAEIAVYKAKETGRNRIVFYNEPMNEIIVERMYIEKFMWSALDNNEFELYYQPQLDLETNTISGFEALIRWKNPELGMVPPKKFIGIAEDNRLIITIGAWVFKTACEFLKRLHELGYKELSIAINISMLQLLQDDFVELVLDTIEGLKLNSKYVELEITESILMESYEAIAGKLKLLRSRGIRIALDDFGKGYSSLNYLKQLPITTLKIDKSFIDTILHDDKNKSLTDLIINMGKSMDLSVVAEGVETQEQLHYLKKYQCNKMQGYLFSKPVPESEIIKSLCDQWKNKTNE